MYGGTNAEKDMKDAESSEKQSDKNIQLSDILENDEDDIPEIIIKYPLGPVIYKYYQGNVVEVAKSEADGLGAFFFCEKDSIFATYFGDETTAVYDFYKMNKDGSVEPIVYIGQDIDYDAMEEVWYVDRVEVDRDSFYEKVEEIQAAYGDIHGNFDYYKSPSMLIDILESGGDILGCVTEIRKLQFESLDMTLMEEINKNARLSYEIQFDDIANDLYFSGNSADGSLQYAFSDIDGDFIDEFIITMLTPYDVDCVTYIYDYNTVSEKAFLIFEGGRDVTIYKNGVIAEYSFNNRTLGLLWPFSIYRMGEYGEYEYETYVSSWEVEYGDYDNGEYFPYDIDADGNGIVYRLYGSYVDDAEFEIWENANMPEESRIQLSYYEWSY